MANGGMAAPSSATSRFCLHTQSQRRVDLEVPPSVRALGVSLFGTQKLGALLRQSRANTFTWAHGNVTLYALQRDHTEFCTGLSYDFRGGIAPGATVLDIGGNIGDTAIQMNALNPRANIIALEPVPISFFFLRWNLEANRVPLLQRSDFEGAADGESHPRGGVLPLHAGATADGRNISLNVNTRFTKNARAVEPGRADQSAFHSTTWEIPKLLDTFRIRERLPLLKIDCEGCEAEVLPALQSSGAIERVDRIVGEVHAPAAKTRVPSYEHLKQMFCQHTSETCNVVDAARSAPHLVQTASKRLVQSELTCFERYYCPRTRG